MTQTDVFAIAGITQANVINYFTTFNEGEFLRTASLFAGNGSLLAPFEKPIIGEVAIADYLIREAQGMKLLPQQGICETEVDLEKYKVLGKVKTSLFSVNVAWYFTLNHDAQIATVQIKLLASPQELLSLKSKCDRDRNS